MQTAQAMDAPAAPQSEGGTDHAAVSAGTKRPLTSTQHTTSAFKAYSKSTAKRSKSTGDEEGPRMSLPHLHGVLQPGVSRQHSNTHSAPHAHPALQMQQEMARAAGAQGYMPLPPQGMQALGLEAYHAACAMAAHPGHHPVPMPAHSNNGAESPYPAEAALLIQHMLNQQRSDSPRSHLAPPEMLHQASRFCNVAAGVPPPELLRTASSISQHSTGCGVVAHSDARSILSSPSQVIPDSTGLPQVRERSLALVFAFCRARQPHAVPRARRWGQCRCSTRTKRNGTMHMVSNFVTVKNGATNGGSE